MYHLDQRVVLSFIRAANHRPKYIEDRYVPQNDSVVLAVANLARVEVLQAEGNIERFRSSEENDTIRYIMIRMWSVLSGIPWHCIGHRA
jgi:hypothetical protein